MMHIGDIYQFELVFGAKELEITLEIVAQRFDKTGQQNSLALPGQMARPMQGDDRFSGSRRAGDFDRAVKSACRQSFLRRMKEGYPGRQWRGQQRAQIIVTFNQVEAPP